MEKDETLIDFNRICRLCMTEEVAMSSIFCEQIGAVPLPLRIMACVSIEITATDGLPTMICNSCLLQVDGWYKFKDLCENADTTLRKLINNEPVDYTAITTLQKTAGEVKKYFSTVPYKNESHETSNVQETEKAEQRRKLKSVETVQSGYHEVKLEVLEPAQSLQVLTLQYPDNFPNGSESGPDEDTSYNNIEDNEGYSSDDNLNLLATKEKLLKERKLKKRGRVKKIESAAEEKRLARTVQTQTEGDDVESAFEEVGVEEMVEEDQKKGKNKRTQTPGEDGEQRKRFRIRPAVPSACTLCDKVYKNPEILRQHMKSHHVSGNIECPHCQMKFVSVRSLKYHEQRKHSNLEPVPCSFCGKKFLDKKYLRIHENIHSQTNQYVCQFCGRKFIMKTNLTVHISRHHTQKTNDFICQVCGKAFPFKLYLKKHFKTHTDYKPHGCSHCDARFRETTLLRKHINSIHLKLRPFLCQYCQKTFTRSLYLREHMESQHLGIPKKVECVRCGESFHNRGRLRQHECEGTLEVH